MRKRMKIALINLSHMTAGVQTNTVPLEIGVIARYLEKSLSSYKFDIRLFKNPTKFLDILKRWTPEVLGISQYPWNSELNHYMARLMKVNNPGCLVVAGGPNLYTTPEEKLAYLEKQKFIDLCVNFDGEIPFTEIVKRLIDGERIDDIRRSPPVDCYAIDITSGRLIESGKPAPRLKSLDVFGSMYAEGYFDEFLDDGFHPFLQTQRGCPFKCAYCRASDDYSSRLVFQSAEHFRRDMEYLGRRFSGQHNVILYLANSNLGLFKSDLEIARVIRDVQDRYDWPKDIYAQTDEKNLGNLVKVFSILKYKIDPAGMSLQTLTPKVLKNINRRNISFKDFVAFQKEVLSKKIIQKSTTELILNLPEETKESFLHTVSLLLNSGVQDITIWTLMSLKGTPIASRQTIKRYGHVIRHRLIPRCFSEIGGVKIFETEEAVIGTNSMPFEDYMDLRGIAFLIVAFVGAIEVFPVKKFMMEHGLNIAQWLFNIKDMISDFPGLNAVYKSFLQETEKELFPSRDSLIDFFSRQENYESLRAGRYGDNLLRKYKKIVLVGNYSEYLEIVFRALRQLIKKDLDSRLLDSLMNDLEIYLKTRDVAYIFNEGYNQRAPRNIILRYDIPRWLAAKKDNTPLEAYKGSFSYSTVVTDYMRNRLKDYRRLNRDPELSLQVLYRDGYIKDFWPLWISNSDSKVRVVKHAR